MVLSVLLCSVPSFAEIKSQSVPYKHNGVNLEGVVFYSDDTALMRPGVMVVHAWMGLDEHAKESAKKLAELGYVAFCADIYGKGKNPADSAAAAKLSGSYKKDRQLYRGRLNAGLETLKRQKLVDRRQTAAIGYCFGGTGVIELVRSGAEIDGVVSFHGGLDSPSPADGKNIQAKVLALHGADDPFVKPEDLAAFEGEMRAHKVDWQLVKYGNAVHSFTHKTAGNDNSKGAAYNKQADERSWEEMKLFLAEIFK